MENIQTLFTFTQVCAITIDSASNNKKMMQLLAKKLKRVHISCSEEMCVPYLAHVINLFMHKVLDNFCAPLSFLELHGEQD